jgi:hypothetical protein
MVIVGKEKIKKHEEEAKKTRIHVLILTSTQNIDQSFYVRVVEVYTE